MKSKIVMMLLALVFCSCGGAPQKNKLKTYGDVSAQREQTFTEVDEALRNKHTVDAKVKGIITDINNNRSFWLQPFKKGVDPIYVELRAGTVSVTDDFKGKAAVIEGEAMHVVVMGIKPITRLIGNVNMRVWCPMNKPVKDDAGCIKVCDACCEGITPDIELQKNTRGNMVFTQITARGMQVNGL